MYFLSLMKYVSQVPEFEKAAFDAPVNKVVKCKTKFGWHLLQVLSERYSFYKPTWTGKPYLLKKVLTLSSFLNTQGKNQCLKIFNLIIFMKNCKIHVFWKKLN